MSLGERNTLAVRPLGVAVPWSAVRRSSIAELSSSQPWNGRRASWSVAMYPAIGVASRSSSIRRCVRRGMGPVCLAGGQPASVAVPEI